MRRKIQVKDIMTRSFCTLQNLQAQRKVALAFGTLLLYGPLLVYIGTAPISEVSIASTWEYGDQLGFCSFVLLLSGVASTAGIFALPKENNT